MLDYRRDFERYLGEKRKGGVKLTVGVSSNVWMGGLIEEISHEPFVVVGPEDGESEEFTYFASRQALQAFVDELSRAADEAWGPPEP